MSNGLYLCQYVPKLAGTYTLSITLLGVGIAGSPWTVIVSPGEIDPAQCTSNLGAAPLYATAGLTKFFTIITYDMYGNRITQSYGNNTVSIFATYVNNTKYTSPLGIPDLSNWAQIYG